MWFNNGSGENEDSQPSSLYEEYERGPKEVLKAVGNYSALYSLMMLSGVALLAHQVFGWLHQKLVGQRNKFKFKIDCSRQQGKKSGENGTASRQVDDVIDFDEGRKEVPQVEIVATSRESVISDAPQDDKPEPNPVEYGKAQRSTENSSCPTTIGELIRAQLDDQSQKEEQSTDLRVEAYRKNEA